MCALCDGMSVEEYADRVRGEIYHNGFAISQVGDGPQSRGISYTIGLAERKHPEVLIVGYPLDEATEVLRKIGWFVTRSGRIDWRRRLLFRGCGTYGLVKVDQVHLDAGLMDAWDWVYGDDEWYTLRAMQVVMPDEGQSYEHQTTQPLLGRLPRRRRPRAKKLEEERLVIRLAS